MLGVPEEMAWSQEGADLKIALPGAVPNSRAIAFRVIES